MAITEPELRMTIKTLAAKAPTPKHGSRPRASAFPAPAGQSRPCVELGGARDLVETPIRRFGLADLVRERRVGPH